VNEKDFSDPRLKNIYKEWSINKHLALDYILKIGKDEWYSQKDISEMKLLMDKYMNHFWI
jgi:hypothetical protein